MRKKVTSMNPRTVGIIGGTGLYMLDGLAGIRERKVSTPFGSPSDVITEGTLDGVRLLFLPRHGKGHRFSPSSIPFRANIFAMKKLGAEWLISVSAVGSLREELSPGDLVIVDQFIDKTYLRKSTFFDDGLAVHVSFANPVCGVLASILYETGKEEGLRIHMGGTYCCMEGPAFSSRAESNMHIKWGADLIGMTNLPEAKLAREAEICYATIAIVTDYDCWKSPDADVSIEEIIKTLKAGTDAAKRLVRRAVGRIDFPKRCLCSSSLRNAIVTDRKRIPAGIKRKLAPLIGKYMKGES